MYLWWGESLPKRIPEKPADVVLVETESMEPMLQ
jgi:hypothetical protein